MCKITDIKEKKTNTIVITVCGDKMTSKRERIESQQTNKQKETKRWNKYGRSEIARLRLSTPVVRRDQDGGHCSENRAQRFSFFHRFYIFSLRVFRFTAGKREHSNTNSVFFLSFPELRQRIKVKTRRKRIDDLFAWNFYVQTLDRQNWIVYRIICFFVRQPRSIEQRRSFRVVRVSKNWKIWSDWPWNGSMSATSQSIVTFGMVCVGDVRVFRLPK